MPSFRVIQYGGKSMNQIVHSSVDCLEDGKRKIGKMTS